MGRQPGRIRLGLLVALQQRQDGFGGVFEGREVHDVFPTQALLDVAEELLHLVPVHILQYAQGIVVKILLCPLVSRLHKVINGHRVLLARG